MILENHIINIAKLYFCLIAKHFPRVYTLLSIPHLGLSAPHAELEYMILYVRIFAQINEAEVKL